MITHSELLENWQRMDATAQQGIMEAWLADLATWKQRAEAAEAEAAKPVATHLETLHAYAREQWRLGFSGRDFQTFQEWADKVQP